MFTRTLSLKSPGAQLEYPEIFSAARTPETAARLFPRARPGALLDVASFVVLVLVVRVLAFTVAAPVLPVMDPYHLLI